MCFLTAKAVLHASANLRSRGYSYLAIQVLICVADAEFSAKNEPNKPCRKSPAQIAALLGAARSNIIKALKKGEYDGIIRVGKRDPSRHATTPRCIDVSKLGQTDDATTSDSRKSDIEAYSSELPTEELPVKGGFEYAHEDPHDFIPLFFMPLEIVPSKAEAKLDELRKFVGELWGSTLFDCGPDDYSFMLHDILETYATLASERARLERLAREAQGRVMRALYVCQKCGQEVGEGEKDSHHRHAYCGGSLDPNGEYDEKDEAPALQPTEGKQMGFIYLTPTREQTETEDEGCEEENAQGKENEGEIVCTFAAIRAVIRLLWLLLRSCGGSAKRASSS
jgi:hypothetical protein